MELAPGLVMRSSKSHNLTVSNKHPQNQTQTLLRFLNRLTGQLQARKTATCMKNRPQWEIFKSDYLVDNLSKKPVMKYFWCFLFFCGTHPTKSKRWFSSNAHAQPVQYASGPAIPKSIVIYLGSSSLPRCAHPLPYCHASLLIYRHPPSIPCAPPSKCTRS